MKQEKKAPLIRLAKREGLESWKIWCIRAGAIVFALLLGALVMGLVGANPFAAYGTIVSGALGKKSAIRQTVKIAVPLLGPWPSPPALRCVFGTSAPRGRSPPEP